MASPNKHIPTVSIVLGVLLTAAGVAAIGFYIFSVVTVMDEPDRSLIFWYSVFLYFGLIISSLGAYFIVVGWKATKGSKRAALLTQRSVLLFTIIVALLVIRYLWQGFEMKNEQAAYQAKMENFRALERRIHKIEQIEITDFGSNGFNLRLSTSGSLFGRYRIILRVRNTQALFLEKEQTLQLLDSRVKNTMEVSFEQLFQKCFDEFRNSNIYVCIPGAGTANTRFTVEARLFPTEATLPDSTSGFIRAEELFTTSETGFSVDTVGEPDRIVVEQFRPLH
ncbi:MAG: hypothetical protein R3211_01460 [Balneolaceae bacterium]|nr:hypothetical protein [Balneolaceae bacterium]